MQIRVAAEDYGPKIFGGEEEFSKIRVIKNGASIIIIYIYSEK